MQSEEDDEDEDIGDTWKRGHLYRNQKTGSEEEEEEESDDEAEEDDEDKSKTEEHVTKLKQLKIADKQQSTNKVYKIECAILVYKYHLMQHNEGNGGAK